MTKRIISAAVLLAGSAWAFEDNRISSEEQKDGWILLFDGRSTQGWLEVTGKPFPHQSWTIEDYSLKTLAGVKSMQDLRTVARFGHFELQFDWKLADTGNSGVKYLVQRVDEWTSAQGRQARGRGFEYQLAGGANAEAAADATRSRGSLYSVLAPDLVAPVPTGAFNRSRIIVDAAHVEHWLNGVRILTFDVNAPAIVKLLQSFSTSPEMETFIVLQNHASEVWFRNIKIKRLE